MIDIFSVAEQTPHGEFFKFEKIGDQIQGTFIDAYETQDSYGNDQRVVVLKDSNDKVWNIGIRIGTVFHKESLPMILGEIIGFRYDRDVPSKVKKGTNAKVINIYRDPSVIDQRWLAERAERRKDIESVGERVDTEEEVTSDVTGGDDDDPSVVAIRTLAMTKGLTTEDQSVEEQDEAIQEYAGMEYGEENNTKIIIKLSSLSL